MNSVRYITCGKTDKRIVNHKYAYHKFIYALLLCAVMVLYASIYFNNTFPLSEGWNVNYAELVLHGKFPYRDFYYFLPPLNLLIDIITWKLSFGLLIVYRAWWLAQRIVIFELLFFLLCRYYKPLCAFLACSFASVLGTASVYDLFGDYNQTAVLLSVLLIYCSIGFTDARSLKRKCGMLFLAGILFGALFLNKQTVFVASVIIYFSVLCLLCWNNKDRNFWKYCVCVLCGALIILLPVFLLLVKEEAFILFIEQVFLHTGGKGSLVEIIITKLLNKLPHIFVWLFVCITLMVVYLGKQKSHDAKCSMGRMTFLFLIIAAFIFCQNDITPILDVIEGYTVFQIVACIGTVPFLVIIAMNLCNRGPAFLRSHNAILFSVLFLCGVLLIGGYAVDMNTEYLVSTIYYGDESDGLFSLILNGWYFAVFYFVIVLLAMRFWLSRHSCDGNRSEKLLWISCGAFSTIYAASMASGSELSFHGMMIGLAFVFCEAFSVTLNDKTLETALKSVALLACTAFSFVCVAQKDVCAYSWWGGETTQAKSEKTYTTDIPALRGFCFSEDLRNTYEEVVELIEENSDEDAVIYGFPYIKIFNVLTERYNYDTFVPVMFYDVVDDSYVEMENELLKDNLPDILILQDIPGCMEVHETLFRDGETLEQRNTIALFEEVIPTEYEMLGTFSNLTVYKLRENEIECFSEGNGTYDKPYLIETAEQLIAFGELVNDGTSFEGCYIRQTADSDMDGYSWTPIGEYDSGNYFYGTYDGDGHVIKNITVDQPESNVGGLFGALAGEVYNLGVEGGSLNGACVGGIASHSYGDNAKIINCYTDIPVSGYRAAGIADNFSGTIINCFSFGETSGIESANVISYNSTKEVKNVFVNADVLCTDFYTEFFYDTRITYCKEELINSDTVVNRLNEYVDTVNGENQEDEENEENEDSIKLIYWQLGNEGHPIFRK